MFVSLGEMRVNIQWNWTQTGCQFIPQVVPPANLRILDGYVTSWLCCCLRIHVETEHVFHIDTVEYRNIIYQVEKIWQCWPDVFHENADIVGCWMSPSSWILNMFMFDPWKHVDDLAWCVLTHRCGDFETMQRCVWWDVKSMVGC